MAGNTFGQLFRVTTFGESHGEAVGVVIDGCPPGLAIKPKDIQKELDKRKPGQSKVTTQRKEQDEVKIVSGIMENKTTGAPILLLVYNHGAITSHYEEIKNVFRPGHADLTYFMKYGHRDWRGGGRSSGRETLARVAAGAIAKKYLEKKANIKILSYVEQIGNLTANIDYKKINEKQIESNVVRCPEQAKAKKMIQLIEKLKNNGDSIGGIIKGIIYSPPSGLGEPVFDKLSADLAKAMLSIGASKGFEYGNGFDSSRATGSSNNDQIINSKGIYRTKDNKSGGILGGISTGEDIVFRVAFKPASSIAREQTTINTIGKRKKISIKGRHDPCIVPRAVPVVTAMASLVIMDHYLRHKSIK